MIDLASLLTQLADQRPIFHSEADFQHAIAWAIQQRIPDASIRLEYPVLISDRSCHLDIWIVHKSATVAIELKYKTHALKSNLASEFYFLKSHSAQDQGRYDFFKDVQRMEQFVVARENTSGYAILLTNDSAYWKPSTNLTAIDVDFRLQTGRIAEGTLKWGLEASTNTTKGRTAPIILRGSYPIKWEHYSTPINSSYGTFRYLMIQVS